MILHRSRRAAAAAALGFWAAAAAASAAPVPQRIVSLNLCADQLVMLLADRRRIASVSYLAADPDASAMADKVPGLHVNHGFAEEILPLKPDLVLAGTFSARPTVFLLRRLGYPVFTLPVATDIADIRDNIRALSAAIGETKRGEAVINAFDSRLAGFGIPDRAKRPLAALYGPNGYTAGRGTLANAVLKAAGFRTLAEALGYTGTASLALETLVKSAPDLLVFGRVRAAPALATETFRHPALRATFAARPAISIPNRLWVCGTPFVADAIARLAAVRDREGAQR